MAENQNEPEKNDKNNPNRKNRKVLTIVLVCALAVVLLFGLVNMGGDSSDEIPYSQFTQMVEEDQVTEVELNGSKMTVRTKDKGEEKGKIYKVTLVGDENSLKDLLEGHNIKYSKETPGVGENILSMLISVVLPIVLLAGVFVYLMKGRGGIMSVGRSRAKAYVQKDTGVTFADVAGEDEAKESLQEVVEFLHNPEQFRKIGAVLPKGALLVGPPGTGKTLLAKAVAGEAGVPFFSLSGSEFVEMFVGVGASRVRNLFQNAKKKAPCIVFIDEIDAVGRHRGAGLGGGHDEREQTLNQLLVEMDGFGPNEGVIVLAATNRPDILDGALLRPGRFDRRVFVMRPDIKGRKEILEVHARNKPFADDVDLGEIAKITPGFTGADLENLLNEAALLAARRNDNKIHYSDISEAVFKVTIGPEKKSRVINKKERELTAYHESGHAIVLREKSDTDRVERVSIIPAGGAGGYTAFKPNEDMYFKTKSQLETEIMVALGGRAAEQVIFNEISTGASADLKECNKVARDMVTKYGMSERLGNFVSTDDKEIFVGRDYGHVQNHSDAMQSAIDEEVSMILEKAYKETLDVLNDNRTLLDQLANVLLEKEKIEGDDFEEIYQQYATTPKPLPSAEG